MTPNEAREALRLEEIEGFDTPRVPANIAGSAANPEEGGQTTRRRLARKNNDKRYDDKGFVRVYGVKKALKL